MSIERPALMTFDIFGTVLAWRAGMRLAGAPFERVIDRRCELEQQARFRPYAEIVAQSLVEVVRLSLRLSTAGSAPKKSASTGRR